MIIIPAIDIKGGKCVRLTQGNYDKESVYFDDPVSVAKNWKEKGVKYLHLVDLDGALEGKRINGEIIKDIASTLDVELGGGIRTMENIEEAFSYGVKRVIIGTSAVKNPELVKNACQRYGDRIIVGIDAKGGMVATDGWTKVLDISAVDFGLQMKALGVTNIIYTDIAKDGMLSGPNIKELVTMQSATGINITASGGVSSLRDIEELKNHDFYGAIVGKAIYEGKIKLEDIL
ncbi:MAG: 1-(5-phosphoribosyl)-5-[Lachnospiraceae bacterium]|nr:1-(5-phosphoribosyl)-5-[(5-phosphoribosylamino)methylideneamino]imidazole-4-carboxamide isomerase [Lachnospiraceae bacterium]